jgi:hypothetical protein
MMTKLGCSIESWNLNCKFNILRGESCELNMQAFVLNLQPFSNCMPGAPEYIQDPRHHQIWEAANAKMGHWFHTEMFVIGLFLPLQQEMRNQGYTTLQEAYNVTIHVEKPAHDSCQNQLLQLAARIKAKHQQQSKPNCSEPPKMSNQKYPPMLSLLRIPPRPRNLPGWTYSAWDKPLVI